MDNKKIYLVRHAQSYNNIKDANYTFNPDLTAIGMEQAVKVSQYFDKNIKLIIHSGLIRTEKTARYTIERFPFAKVRQWDVQEFNYLGENYNTTICKTKRKVDKNIYWKQADLNYKYNDESESFYNFLKRVESFIYKIQDNDFDEIVVFSHKYFIKGVLWCSIICDKKTYYSLSAFNKFCNLYLVKNADIIPCLIKEGNFYIAKSIVL